MSTTSATGPWCGCPGCRKQAIAIIAHPNGDRAVCEDHAAGYEVIQHLA